MRRRSEEEKEARRRAKAEAAETKQLEKEKAAEAKRIENVAKAAERMRQSFLNRPAGQARQAFERGDQVFHCSIDVVETKTAVVSMAGAYTRSKDTNDPTVVLNSVCHEGWELVNGSFVFLQLGSEGRDKFMSSGQQIAVKGTILGYYLFKRCEASKREMQMPWEAAAYSAPPDQAESLVQGQ